MMVHQTLEKFGYPDTVIKEYAHWVVCLRPKQATLGALVLVATSDVAAFSSLEAAAFAEMQVAVQDIEAVLGEAFSYNKINYLMLMMVDPQVHYHVLPRYEAVQEFDGVLFEDPGWPGVPDLGHAAALDDAGFAGLLERLRTAWP